MKENAIIHRRVCFSRVGRQRKLQQTAENAASVSIGRVPRVARLMALAIRLEELIASGQVPSYAKLARLAHVSRARISQITNLHIGSHSLMKPIKFPFSARISGSTKLPTTIARSNLAIINWTQPYAAMISTTGW